MVASILPETEDESCAEATQMRNPYCGEQLILLFLEDIGLGKIKR